MKLSEVNIGKTFSIADIEFIKFSQDGDRTVAVAKDCLCNSVFGDNNNFANSEILKKLQDELLPKIESEVGTDKVLEFETDLLSLDGSDEYGKITTKISIPTFDFYRQNVKLFDEYNPGRYWWLATPDSTSEHINDRWVVCVAPSGGIDDIYYGLDSLGVRPFCVFESSISVSSEE